MDYQPNEIRNSTRRFYDNVAEKFSQTRKNWWPGFNFTRKYLKGKAEILDFGCGNGRLLKFLRLEGTENFRYTGVDISKQLIFHAKQHFPEENFLAIDNEGVLPFKNGQFDIILSFAVFHHFNPLMAEGSFRELRRVIKDDGIVIITVWYLWNKRYFPFLFKEFLTGRFSFAAEIPFNDEKKIHWRYCYWWRKSSLVSLVKKQGFVVLETGYTVDKGNNKRNIYVVAKKAPKK